MLKFAAAGSGCVSTFSEPTQSVSIQPEDEGFDVSPRIRGAGDDALEFVSKAHNYVASCSFTHSRSLSFALKGFGICILG